MSLFDDLIPASGTSSTGRQPGSAGATGIALPQGRTPSAQAPAASRSSGLFDDLIPSGDLSQQVTVDPSLARAAREGGAPRPDGRRVLREGLARAAGRDGRQVSTALGEVGYDLRDAGRTLGTMIGQQIPQSAAVIQKAGQRNAARFGRQQIEAMDRIDAGESVADADDALGYQYMTPEQRQEIRAEMQAAQEAFDPGEVRDSRLYRLGQAAGEAIEQALPRAEHREGTAREAVAEAFGSLFGFVGLSLATGGTAGAYTLAATLGVGDQFERAKESGLEDEEALRVAAGGGPAGMIAVMSIDRILKTIPPGARGPLTEYAKNVAAAFGAEFVAENLSNIAQNAIEQSYNPERGLTDETPWAGLTSGTAAGMMNAMLQLVSRRGAQRTGQAPVEPPEGLNETAPPVDPIDALGGEAQGTMAPQQAPMTATPAGTQAPATTPAQAEGMAVPPPTQDRERLGSPRLTPEDRAAPEPNDLLDDGKQIIERALRGEAPVSDTKLRADTPASRIAPETQGQAPGAQAAPIVEGSRVEVVTPDGEVITGTVRGMVDVGQDDMATDFVSDQGEASLFYPGEVQISPVRPEQPTTQGVPVGEPVPRQDAVIPQGQAAQQGRDVVPAPTTAPATMQRAPAQAPQAATQAVRALPAPDTAPAPQAAPQPATAPQRSPAQLGRDWAGLSREQRASATQGIQGLPANVLDRRWGLIPASARSQIAERMAAMREAPAPEVAPPATQEAPARQARARRRREPRNLIEFIVQQGGISVNDPLAQDIRDMVGGGRSNRLVPGFGPLLQRAKGKELDRLRVAAIEAGWLDDYGARDTMIDTMTVPEFIEIIRAELNPTRRDDASVAAEQDAQQAEYDQIREQIRTDLIEAGLTDRDFDPEYLDLATMRVLDGLSEVQHAYVEAVMQVSRERDEAGDYRTSPVAEAIDDLPGWDDATLYGRPDQAAGDASPAGVDPVAQEQPGTVGDSAAGRGRPQEAGRAPREAEPAPAEPQAPVTEAGADGLPQQVIPGAEARADMFDAPAPAAQSEPAPAPPAAERLTAERLRATLNTATPAARAEDGRAYRIRADRDDGHIGMRMPNEPGMPPRQFRPPVGERWTVEQAIEQVLAQVGAPVVPQADAAQADAASSTRIPRGYRLTADVATETGHSVVVSRMRPFATYRGNGATREDAIADAVSKTPASEAAATDVTVERVSEDTFRSWRRSVPSPGVARGWRIFNDTQIRGQWSLMSRELLAAPFTSEEAARAWARENPAAQATPTAAPQAEAPTFPTTLEDIAPRGRFNHVYAEHQGRRYYLGSVAANADTMVEQMRDRFPGVAVFAVDRADSTRIHGDIDALQAAVGETGAAPAPTQEAPAAQAEAAPSGPETAPAARIDDFGERLEGARKDYAQKMREAMDSDIASVPLAKAWPEPNYQQLLDAGTDPFAVAFMHAARDAVPPKPRTTWKLREWVKMVEGLRDLNNKIVNGEISAEALRDRMDAMTARGVRGIRGRADLYQAVGHEKSLKGVKLTEGKYSLYGGVKYDPPLVRWTVARDAKATAFGNWPTELAVGATRDEAIANFAARYNEIDTQPEARRQVKFDLYSYRRGPKAGRFWLGVKIGREYLDLRSFADRNEARSYLRENEAELQAQLEQMRAIPSERRTENAPRVGHDHRNGADVTPQMFQEAFGFRGVQFGNYVEGGRRQADLNEAYDALMDMAGVLGIPSRAISLNGELGLAFGARGKGGKRPAAAHFETNTVVINLTKRRGAGSLAHEWWHALDNYFSRQRQDPQGFLSERAYPRGEGVRPEVVDAFKGVVAAINDTSVRKRSQALDKRRTKAYWSTGREMSARAFESYMIAKLRDQNASNDYLANIVSEEYWNAETALGIGEGDAADQTYPYLTAGETPAVVAAFDDLFNTIDTRETESGIQMFAVRGRTSPFFSPVERAVEGIQQERGNGLQWLAMIRKQPGVKQEELDWIGLPQWLSDRKGITKQEVLDYIAANKVSVEETTLGDVRLNLEDAGVEINEVGEQWEVYDEGDSYRGPFDTRSEAEAAAQDLAREILTSDNTDMDRPAITRYDSYTLPGGENYRELLIRMPESVTTPEPVDMTGWTVNTVRENSLTGQRDVAVRDADGKMVLQRFGFQGTDAEMLSIAVEQRQERAVNRAKKKENYISPHFSEPNILAHIRFNERTVDGERVLFIEEIQSDWHQKGRKGGYRSASTAEVKSRAETELSRIGINKSAENVSESEVRNRVAPNADLLEDVSHPALDALREFNRTDFSAMAPDAPLKKTWHETAFRRAVAWAVENGFDRVAWTTGQTQADRFDLSKRVESIKYNRNEDGMFNMIVTGLDQTRVFEDSGLSLAQVEETIGKEMAQKMDRGEGDPDPNDVRGLRGSKQFTGLDLRVGGEGMKGFYDQIVPKYAQKWGRKFGAEVGKTNVPTQGDAPVEAWTMPITDQMRESIGTDGVPLFQAGDAMADQVADAGESADPRAFAIREQSGGVTTELTLTEPFVEASAALETALREQLDGMGLRDVAVRVPQMIRFMTQEGEFSADGRYLRGVIDIALDAPDPNVTMRHEAIHALRRMGLFTESEWSILSSQSRRKWMAEHNVARDYGAFPEWMQVEEGIAYAFQGWQAGGQATQTVARIFRKISNFIEALGNALRGNGFQSVDDIFSRVESGEIGSRGLDADAGATDQDQAFQIRRDEDNAARASAAMDAEDGGLGIEESSEIRGADRQFVSDMGRWTKLAHYPREMAMNSASFRPVYQAAVDQVQKRDLNIADLHRRAQKYFDLPNESRAKVNAVLEVGRLSGREYRVAPGKPINIVNDVRDTELSKKGERISLTAEEADAYRAVRDTMNSALGMFREQVTKEFGLDPKEFQTSKQIFDSITKDMPESAKTNRNLVGRLVREIEQAERTGYVPLSRFGNVIVTVRKPVENPDPLVGNPMEMETVWSRAVPVPNTGLPGWYYSRKQLEQIPAVRKVMEEARALHGDDADAQIRAFQKPERGVDANNNITSGDVDLLAEVANLDMDQHDRLMEAFNRLQQERGFRRHFLGSRNVPGYDADFERTIADYIQGIGSYLARREMRDTWDNAISAIPDLRPNERAYAEKYQKYVNNPTEEFGNFRQAAFVYFLAGNVSTAALNLTQVPLFTMPYMTMFDATSPARFLRAYADTGRMMSVEAGTEIFTPEKAPADVREALTDAYDRGMFMPLVTYEMMGTAHNRNRMLRGLSRKVRKAVDIVALTYSFSERANRLSTYIAAYRLAKQKPDQVRERARDVLRDNPLARDQLLGIQDNEAFARAFAEWMIDETHFKLGKINRPEMFRGFGAPMLQFKSFVWSALSLQKRMLQGKYGRAGRVALGLNLLGLFATAGIWGLPGSDDLREALEAILRIWSEEDRDIQTEVREAITEMTGSPKVADLFSRGALRATGLDMSQRIGMGRVVPRSADEAAGVPFSLMVGKPMTTYEYARRGDWMLAAGEALPNFLRNPIQGMAWGSEGIRGVASGQMVVPPEEIGASDQVMRGLGFQPTWIARRREGDWAGTRADRALDGTRRRFYGMLARPIADAHRAMERGDVEAHARALAAMEEAQSALQDHNMRAMEAGEPHRVIQINNRSLRMRVQQEIMGTAVRDQRGRTTTRGRRQEIRELYNFE